MIGVLGNVFVRRGKLAYVLFWYGQFVSDIGSYPGVDSNETKLTIFSRRVYCAGKFSNKIIFRSTRMQKCGEPLFKLKVEIDSWKIFQFNGSKYLLSTVNLLGGGVEDHSIT